MLERVKARKPPNRASFFCQAYAAPPAFTPRWTASMIKLRVHKFKLCRNKGAISLLFGGSFKLAIRAIWSCKPLIFIQLLKLQRINPFPQELILPQNFFRVPSQFSIFPIYIHASIMSMSMKAAGPNPALLMHSSFILFKEKRSLDRRQELPRWHQRQGSSPVDFVHAERFLD